jgi:hypothetical protein
VLGRIGGAAQAASRIETDNAAGAKRMIIPPNRLKP